MYLEDFLNVCESIHKANPYHASIAIVEQDLLPSILLPNVGLKYIYKSLMHC